MRQSSSLKTNSCPASVPLSEPEGSPQCPQQCPVVKNKMGYECFQKEVSSQTLHTQKTKDISSFKARFNLIFMRGN